MDFTLTQLYIFMEFKLYFLVLTTKIYPISQFYILRSLFKLRDAAKYWNKHARSASTVKQNVNITPPPPPSAHQERQREGHSQQHLTLQLPN